MHKCLVSQLNGHIWSLPSEKHLTPGLKFMVLSADAKRIINYGRGQLLYN